MSDLPIIDKYAEFPDFRDFPLSCEQCGTAEFLCMESIQPCTPRASGMVAVEYSCENCEAYFAHDATVQNVASILSTTPGPGGVLHFGHFYIHCGEPMELYNIQLSPLKISAGDFVNAPAVPNATKVLRCQCGFQMSIPTPGFTF